MSCPTPTYAVTMLVTPPTAPLTQDAFFQEATVRCWAAGVQYTASSGISHTPAYLHEDWPHAYDMPARTEYYVQVRDLRTGGYGSDCFTARGTTAEACLTELARQLRALGAAA